MRTLKPFNLEEAKAGKAVQTRSGLPVRIVSYDRKNNLNQSIVALVAFNPDLEKVYYYDDSGHMGYSTINHELDLFMGTIKREGWVNVYKVLKIGTVVSGYEGGQIYPTPADAVNLGGMNTNYLDTIKIEWEE